MVLKFKVWRLQWENRGPKAKRRMLVLRDKSGRIRKTAKDAITEYRLTKWYEDYNIKERLENLLATRKLKEHVRKLKMRTRRRGFKYQMSFYGVWKNPSNDERGYRRYEVFKAEKWTPDEVAFIHDFLKTHVPLSRAGVFIFHNGSLMVDEKDELTKFKKEE